MERKYILHTFAGVKIFTATEIIANALAQEKEGIKPSFCLYNHVTKTATTPKGWLVWSTSIDGCGIVYRRESDGKMIIITGFQGDFCTC